MDLYRGMDALTGRRIDKAEINKEKDLVVLTTDKGPMYITWEGSCCAKCYLAHVSGTDALVGAVINEVDSAHWVTRKAENGSEALESMGTKIRTDKGYVTFESRLEHNGYYSGDILVSDETPMDEYGIPRYKTGFLPDLELLTDF